MKKDLRFALSSSAAFLVTVSSMGKAFAAPYDEGCKAYNAKQYAQAKVLFERAAAANPNQWLVHYQLGNTYLALGQKDRARQSYEKALDCSPPAAYKANINKAMSYLGVPVGDKKEAIKAVEKNKDEEAESKADKGKTAKSSEKEDPVKAKIEARKKQILADAEKESTRIKAERKRKHDQDAQGKWYRVDGETKEGFSKEEETEFNAETDKQVAKVMDEAKRKAESVNSP